MHTMLLALLSDGSWPHSPINDEITLIKSLLAYGILAGILLYPLIRGVMLYRDEGSLTSFIPFLCMVVVCGGIWAWFGHFATHGGFFLWPIFVALVVLILVIIRATYQERQAREHAEELKEFPEPPNTGGPASKSDFKDW